MIYDAENKIRSRRLKLERGIVLDDSGKVLELVIGTADEVDMKDYLYECIGKVFTHNHPMSECFSVADIGFAHMAKLADMRVVCNGCYVCSMRPDKNPFTLRRFKQSCIPLMRRMMREKTGLKWNPYQYGECHGYPECHYCHNEQWQACNYLMTDGNLIKFWREFAERAGYKFDIYYFDR